ncbi:hypothetical protein Leryth_000350 [Lithospermum erythrorhizon]|nr:hypothetical protein Leryth_000350 [Lithospermum erythrorhizon]
MNNPISAILLDASVLLVNENDNEDDNNIDFLNPRADYMLRMLHYSKIPFGLSYGQGLSAIKVSHLQQIGNVYSCRCFVWNSTSAEDFIREVAQAFGDVRGYFVHVVSSQIEDELVLKLKDSLWVMVLLQSVEQKSTNGTSLSEYSKAIFIDKIEELPLTICCLIKKAMDKENIKTIAYTMKPSREDDFIKRGAFPLCPTESGLMFLPLSYELPLPTQLKQVDALLHKVTDEIVSIEMSSTDEFIDRIIYTSRMQELQRGIECQPSFCIIDPFDKIYPILDRLRIQEILLGLEGFKTLGHQRIRGPHFLKVNSFDEPNLEKEIAGARLSLPNIVKPQVACGVADAHSMAIVFKVDDYKGLNVPLPAILQEYVDHSSCIYKFYVVGRKVFYAIKKSTPNAQTLMKFSEGLKPLLFDSLKSLPVVKEKQQNEDNKSRNPDHCMDLELVTDAANWLRQILNFTIFGFDVV